MLSFRKISGKTWFYFLENPAKLHYDSMTPHHSLGPSIFHHKALLGKAVKIL
jgi:hypothetical protein